MASPILLENYLASITAAERAAVAKALGILGRKAERWLKPANKRVVVLGDSMTKPTDYAGVPTENQWWAHVRRQTKGRIEINEGYVFGTGGIAIPTIVSDHLAGAIATDAGTLIFMGGTNDTRFGNVTTAQSKAAIDKIVADGRAAGKIVVLCDGIPWGTATGSLAFGVQSKYIAIRDYIRSLHAPEDGVIWVNTWDAVAPNPYVFDARAGLLTPSGAGEPLHPISAGAKAIADAVISTILSLFGTAEFHDEAGSLYTTGFTGGDSSTAPSLNGVACTIGKHASSGVTHSMVDENGDRWVRFTQPSYALADTSSLAFLTLPNIAPATLGITPGTHKVDVGIKYRHYAKGMRSCDIRVYYLNGGVIIPNMLDTQGYGSAVTTHGVTEDYVEGILHPWAKLLPSDAVRCQPFIQWFGTNGKNVSGELWLAAPKLYPRA